MLTYIYCCNCYFFKLLVGDSKKEKIQIEVFSLTYMSDIINLYVYLK